MYFEDVVVYFELYFFIFCVDDFLRILDIGCGILDFSWEFFEYLNWKCCVDCVDFLFEVIKVMEKFIDKYGILVKMIIDFKESMLYFCDFMGFVCY